MPDPTPPAGPDVQLRAGCVAEFAGGSWTCEDCDDITDCAVNPIETKTCPEHGDRLVFIAVLGTTAYLRCPLFGDGRDPKCPHEESIPCGRLPACGYPPASPAPVADDPHRWPARRWVS